jgi:putative membrane protein
MTNVDDKRSNPPKRQHPISILFFIVKIGKDLVYPLIAILFSAAIRDDVPSWWIAAVIALYVVAFTVLGVLSWLRYTYRIERHSMLVEHGVFIRKRLSIPRDRVQSVDMSAGPVQRLFGVRKLVIETAGSRKPEVVLNAVDEAEAERIRAAMVRDASDGAGPDAEAVRLPASGETEPDPSASEAERTRTADFAGPAGADAVPSGAVYRLPTGRLLLYSATTGRIFLSLAILGALYSQVEDILVMLGLFDPETADAMLPRTVSGWLAVTLAAFAAIWLLGTAIIAAKEYGFTVERRGGKLLIRRGLLEKKQFSVALERIQAVHVHLNPLRRLLGCASVSLVTFASIREDGQVNSLLCPLVPVRDIPGLLADFVPDTVWPDAFERPGRSAVTGYVARPLSIGAILAVPGLIWIPGGYGWTALALPAAALLLGLLRFRHAGWLFRDGQITVRFGSFSVQYALIPRRRIQWLRIKTSPLQKRRGLATLQIITASSGFAAKWQIRHIPERAAEDLMLRLRRPHPSGPLSENSTQLPENHV